jgi:hypothetical protein
MLHASLGSNRVEIVPAFLDLCNRLQARNVFIAASLTTVEVIVNPSAPNEAATIISEASSNSPTIRGLMPCSSNHVSSYDAHAHVLAWQKRRRPVERAREVTTQLCRQSRHRAKRDPRIDQDGG